MNYNDIVEIYKKIEKTGIIKDYIPITKPVMITLMCREIYVSFAHYYLTEEDMAKSYKIPVAHLKRLVKIGSHSMRKQSYLQKYYKKEF